MTESQLKQGKGEEIDVSVLSGWSGRLNSARHGPSLEMVHGVEAVTLVY